MNTITTIQIQEGKDKSKIAAFLRSIVQNAAHTLGTWRQNSRARRELARVSPRDLRDAGISAGYARYEMNQPFWRPLRNQR